MNDVNSINPNTPLLDIVIATYNYAKYLGECLESVIAQTDPRFRVWVMDNASTDNTEELMQTWVCKDTRINYSRNNTNLGPRRNFELGYDKGNAPYVMFLCADDKIAPTFVEELLKGFEIDPNTSLAYSGWKMFADDNLSEYDDDLNQEKVIPHQQTGHFDSSALFLVGNFTTLSFCIFSRSLHDNMKLREERDFETLGDHYVNSALATQGPCYYVENALGFYRKHGNSETDRLIANGRAAEEFVLFHDKIFKNTHIWPEAHRVLAKIIQHHWITQEGLVSSLHACANSRPILRDIFERNSNKIEEMIASICVEFAIAGMPQEKNNDLLTALLIKLSNNEKSEAHLARWMAFLQADNAENDTTANSRITTSLQQHLWYRQWWTNRSNKEHTQELQRLAIQANSIHLACILLPGQENKLLNTIAALHAQEWEQWQLSIIAFTPSITLDSDKITWHELNDEEDSLEVLNKYLTEENADWVSLINAGDTLENDTLLYFSKAALENSKREIIYCDYDLIDKNGRTQTPHFLPDFNLEWLRSTPYINSLLLIKKELFCKINGFSLEAEGIEQYDFLLRSTEKDLDNIFHIPKLLSHKEQQATHTNLDYEAIKLLTIESLNQHYQRLALNRTAVDSMKFPLLFHSHYKKNSTIEISIFIWTSIKETSIKSLINDIEKSNIRIKKIVIASKGEKPSLIEETNSATEIHLLENQENKYSALNSIKWSSNEAILIINHDIKPSNEKSYINLIESFNDKKINVAGCRIINKAGQLLHGGLTGGVAHQVTSCLDYGISSQEPGYLTRSHTNHNPIAVDDGCVLIRASRIKQLGIDTSNLPDRFPFLDFCLKLEKFEIIYRADAEFISSSPLQSQPAKSTSEEHHPERVYMLKKWGRQLSNDPNFNPNLDLTSPDSIVENNPALFRDPLHSNKKLILGYPHDHWARGEYRIKAPIAALISAGKIQGGWSERILGPTELLRLNPENIIVQQQIEAHQISSLKLIKKYTDSKIIFELDDLITASPNSEARQNTDYYKKKEEKLTTALSLCDKLVVSTLELKKHYGHLAKKCVVQPNCIDLVRWGILTPQKSTGKKLRVGWAGGSTHYEDLEFLIPVVKATFKHVDWIFFGMCPDQIRPFAREIHAGVPMAQYPSKLASINLDLAVAPLIDNQFNKAKSALRLLEYGVLGYPTICSNLEPFHGEYPVERINNNPAEWIDAIMSLNNNKELLQEKGNILKKYILENHTLEGNLNSWLESWDA